jgi:hypothetical protein
VAPAERSPKTKRTKSRTANLDRHVGEGKHQRVIAEGVGVAADMKMLASITPPSM